MTTIAAAHLRPGDIVALDNPDGSEPMLFKVYDSSVYTTRRYTVWSLREFGFTLSNRHRYRETRDNLRSSLRQNFPTTHMVNNMWRSARESCIGMPHDFLVEVTNR